MKKIEIKSPTRVDLAGGTLDMWPLFNFTQSAKTINVAIDIYTFADLALNDSSLIEIISEDLKKTWSFNSINELLGANDKDLILFQKVIEKFYLKYSIKLQQQGFQLKTKSNSPIGGGLGGSSSLVISIMKAFCFLTGHQFSSSHEMVNWAHNIEAELLFTPTGTQDYYPAISGGVNILSYSATDVTQNILDATDSPIEENFLLVYTGKSHHSGLNNFEVLKSAVAKNDQVLGALRKIKKIADEMNDLIQLQQWGQIADLFNREYASRIELTSAFTSPEIEKLNSICREKGADAVKICGAGGGGCVLVWVSQKHRQDVIDICKQNGFECLPTKPVPPIKEGFWIK